MTQVKIFNASGNIYTSNFNSQDFDATFINDHLQILGVKIGEECETKLEVYLTSSDVIIETVEEE